MCVDEELALEGIEGHAVRAGTGEVASRGSGKEKSAGVIEENREDGKGLVQAG